VSAYRTPAENDRLVIEVCRELARGGIIKTVAGAHDMPLGTMRKLLARYRRRRKIGSMYALVARVAVEDSKAK
jgi:hypothetical protein